MADFYLKNMGCYFFKITLTLEFGTLPNLCPVWAIITTVINEAKYFVRRSSDEEQTTQGFLFSSDLSKYNQ